MISAPLGDFRHTMHIGRGGDTFGDTSFLSTVGPSPSSTSESSEMSPPPVESSVKLDHIDAEESLHSESRLSSGNKPSERCHGEVCGLRNELNGKKSLDENGVEGDSRIPDGNTFKPKSLRPKVRFSDKREEIIRQASEEEDGQGFDLQDEENVQYLSPRKEDSERVMVAARTTEVELPPSPASSHSSEFEGVTALDRRKVEICHSETDSEEEDDEDEEVGKATLLKTSLMMK
ncbi:hypothetical protein WMY93_025920 [Mugilogobius chulae]|uniref:CRIB domain-containing protein n=1 Tax=Mugilogobius chulae TaxID=88201 RepID=A0AAW0MXM5_9GOBI